VQSKLEEMAGTVLVDRQDVLGSSLAHFKDVCDEDIVEYTQTLPLSGLLLACQLV
jgi:hypothetical protein